MAYPVSLLSLSLSLSVCVCVCHFRFKNLFVGDNNQPMKPSDSHPPSQQSQQSDGKSDKSTNGAAKGVKTRLFESVTPLIDQLREGFHQMTGQHGKVIRTPTITEEDEAAMNGHAYGRPSRPRPPPGASLESPVRGRAHTGSDDVTTTHRGSLPWKKSSSHFSEADRGRSSTPPKRLPTPSPRRGSPVQSMWMDELRKEKEQRESGSEHKETFQPAVPAGVLRPPVQIAPSHSEGSADADGGEQDAFDVLRDRAALRDDYV